MSEQKELRKDWECHLWDTPQSEEQAMVTLLPLQVLKF
jgi:hypothetical protein